MRHIIRRLFELALPANRSAFLWGPRKTGKTWWVGHNLPGAVVIDLLKTDVLAEYASHPALLRERYAKHTGLIDPDDNKFIAGALAGGADYLVSGDGHLLAQKKTARCGLSP